MRTKKIVNQEFTFYNKDEIKYGAKQRVKRFLVARVLPMMQGANSEEEIFGSMLNHPDKFAEYIQLEQDKEETDDIMATMLVTNQSYEELQELSIPVVEALIKEVKTGLKTEEIDNVSDFLLGLGINIQSSLETAVKTKKTK